MNMRGREEASSLKQESNSVDMTSNRDNRLQSSKSAFVTVIIMNIYNKSFEISLLMVFCYSLTGSIFGKTACSSLGLELLLYMELLI